MSFVLFATGVVAFHESFFFFRLNMTSYDDSGTLALNRDTFTLSNMDISLSGAFLVLRMVGLLRRSTHSLKLYVCLNAILSRYRIRQISLARYVSL